MSTPTLMVKGAEAEGRKDESSKAKGAKEERTIRRSRAFYRIAPEFPSSLTIEVPVLPPDYTVAKLHADVKKFAQEYFKPVTKVPDNKGRMTVREYNDNKARQKIAFMTAFNELCTKLDSRDDAGPDSIERAIVEHVQARFLFNKVLHKKALNCQIEVSFRLMQKELYGLEDKKILYVPVVETVKDLIKSYKPTQDIAGNAPQDPIIKPEGELFLDEQSESERENPSASDCEEPRASVRRKVTFEEVESKIDPSIKENLKTNGFYKMIGAVSCAFNVKFPHVSPLLNASKYNADAEKIIVKTLSEHAIVDKALPPDLRRLAKNTLKEIAIFADMEEAAAPKERMVNRQKLFDTVCDAIAAAHAYKNNQHPSVTKETEAFKAYRQKLHAEVFGGQVKGVSSLVKDAVVQVLREEVCGRILVDRGQISESSTIAVGRSAGKKPAIKVVSSVSQHV